MFAIPNWFPPLPKLYQGLMITTKVEYCPSNVHSTSFWSLVIEAQTNRHDRHNDLNTRLCVAYKTPPPHEPNQIV